MLFQNYKYLLLVYLTLGVPSLKIPMKNIQFNRKEDL